jgi:hypothetical protein
LSIVKKISYILFIVLSISAGIWGYFSLKNNKKPQLEAISVLPDSCLIYLTTPNFFELTKRLNEQSLIIDKLTLFKEIRLLSESLQKFDSLFNASDMLQREMVNNPVHFALYGNNLNWLAAFNIRQLGNQDEIEKKLLEVTHAKKTDDDGYEFTLIKNIVIYFTLKSGVVTWANNKALLTLSENKSSAKLYTNPAFLSFKIALEENAALSMYVNHDLYSKSDAAPLLNLTAICKLGFSSGSIDVQPSQLKINGYLTPAKTELISAFASQMPQSVDFVEYLPLTTTYFKAYGFSSFNGLTSKVMELFPKPVSKFWRQIKDSALYNVTDEFYLNVENYLLEFETETLKHHVVMAKIKDTLMAFEHLRWMSDSVLHENSDSIFVLKQIDSKRTLKLFNPLLTCATRYVTLYKSQLFFAEEMSDLRQVIGDLKNDLSLTQSMNFNSYEAQHFPETFNYLLYCSPNRNKKKAVLVCHFTNNSKKDAFENFKHFSFSLSPSEGKFKFRCQLTHEPKTLNKEENGLWTVRLDTSCNMKATKFVNHVTKENELVIQDEAKQLYLINAKGTILWKKKLIEKVTSKIFMVDVFKNNKYQLLFSSNNYLHLIDRNGNYVQGYPIKLESESVCPLSVFDYDNTRDYRLFITCKNNKIYNYAINGKKQEGFTPYKTDNEVHLPIHYIKVGLSDYLVAVDIEGKIYTISRRGDGRIGLKNKVIANCKSFYLDVSNTINSTYLVYVDDKNGLISKISFADKKTIEKLNFDTDKSHLTFSTVEDDKIMNIIFTHEDLLTVCDFNGHVQLKQPLSGVGNETDFYKDESRSLFLTLCNSRTQLIVLDKRKQKSTLFKSTTLPLVSKLFNDNKKYLVITQDNQISCVPLN